MKSKMNLIKVKITPYSSFASFPKGDMLFGQFAYNSFLKGENIFEDYLSSDPKIIFSDFLPNEYLYKPALPMDSFGVEEDDKKEFKKRNWIKIESLKKGIKIENNEDFKPYEDLKFIKEKLAVRNSLNRTNFRTGDGDDGFAPHSLEEIEFLYQPVVYVMFKEPFSSDDIIDRLNEIGKVGFGKKGSIGKGHFKAHIDKSFNGFDELDSDHYLTLSPTILHKSKDVVEKAYYNIFNRFGKYHSTSTPFKKSLLMADSGAVVKLKEKKKWIGGAVDNGIGKQSFVQGYSIVVPFKFDGKGL